ncbi:MAG: ABC transporter substrate-binding protein [Tagaea sp.]
MVVASATFLASMAAAQDRPLQIVSPWEITGLDPARSGFVFGRLQIAETLVGADESGRPAPAIAREWSASEDGLRWRFVLRPGARFHDGTPIDPASVATALNRARANPASMLANAPIAAIEPDGGALIVRLERPFPALPAFFAHSSGIVLAPSAFDASGAVRQIIASGPYRATLVEPPLRVEAERVSPDTPVARIAYLAVPRGETRAAMAESGQADIVYLLPPESVERLKRNARIDVSVHPVPRTRMLKLNAAPPFFDDARAREAVSLAIDRDGIAHALLRSPEAAATQMFPPGMAEWHLPGLPKLAHDPARANALLDALGWRRGSDGVRVKDGRRFSVQLRTFADRPEQPPMAAAIQAQLKDVGIEVAVAIMNSGEIPAGHRDGTLQMALLARNFALVPDPLGTLLQDYGPRGGDWGAMNWSNAGLARAIDGLAAGPDAATRARLRGEIATILRAELPTIPIAWFDMAVGVNKRVTGVVVDPFELSYHVTKMRWAR